VAAGFLALPGAWIRDGEQEIPCTPALERDLYRAIAIGIRNGTECETPERDEFTISVGAYDDFERDAVLTRAVRIERRRVARRERGPLIDHHMDVGPGAAIAPHSEAY
jgi:hypothetical protein